MLFLADLCMSVSCTTLLLIFGIARKTIFTRSTFGAWFARIFFFCPKPGVDQKQKQKIQKYNENAHTSFMDPILIMAEKITGKTCTRSALLNEAWGDHCPLTANVLRSPWCRLLCIFSAFILGIEGLEGHKNGGLHPKLYWEMWPGGWPDPVSTSSYFFHGCSTI